MDKAFSELVIQPKESSDSESLCSSVSSLYSERDEFVEVAAVERLEDFDVVPFVSDSDISEEADDPDSLCDSDSILDPEPDVVERLDPTERVEGFNFDPSDSESNFSEGSGDSSFSGHYESGSSADTNHVICGRWIDPKTLEGLAIPCLDGANSELSSIAELAPFLTSYLDDFTRNLEGRFFAENEYLCLDEYTLSEVFALSVCLALAEGRGGDLETTHMQFFKRQWTQSVHELSENLRSETFSQPTFEAKYDLEWIDHKGRYHGGSSSQDCFD